MDTKCELTPEHMVKYNSDHALEHMNRCRNASMQNPDAFLRVCLLAVGSIRIHSKTFWLKYLNDIFHLFRGGLSMDDINDKHVPFMPMKFKAKAIRYIETNYKDMWSASLNMDSNTFHDYLCNIDGIGPVKAGFIVQMTHNTLGCIDTVNFKRFSYLLESKGWKTLSGVPHIYRKQLDALPENSQELWANWCNAVVARQNKVGDKYIWSPNGLSLAHALFVEQGYYDTEIVAVS